MSSRDSDSTDDDVPFPDATYVPITQPTSLAWRSEPPTRDELEQWPWWWMRFPCCPPDLIVLRINGLLQFATDTADDDDSLDLSDYPDAMYAPAVPPGQGHPSQEST